MATPRKTTPAKTTTPRTPRPAPQDRRAAAEPEPEVLEHYETVEMDVPGEPDDDGKPTTRKVKARRVAVENPVKDGETITVIVPEEALDDFELLDDLRTAQDDQDPTRFPAILRRLVGAEWRGVLDQLRDPVTKRVSVETGAEFVMDLFQALNPS